MPIKKAIPAAHVAPVFVFLFHRSMSRRPRMGTTPRWPVVLGSDAGVMLGPVATNGEFLCSVKVIRAITTTIAARTAMMSPLPHWRNGHPARRLSDTTQGLDFSFRSRVRRGRPYAARHEGTWNRNFGYAGLERRPMTQARSLCHVIRNTQGLPKVRPGLCEARTAAKYAS